MCKCVYVCCACVYVHAYVWVSEYRKEEMGVALWGEGGGREEREV